MRKVNAAGCVAAYPYSNLAICPFKGIVEQVADHLLKILPLTPEPDPFLAYHAYSYGPITMYLLQRADNG